MNLTEADKQLLVGMLSQVDFLVYHSPEEINRILDNIEKIECPAGSVIIKQGEEGRGFFIVGCGGVGIYVQKPSGRVKLAELAAGGYFGEMSLLTNSKCNADAVAEADSVVYRVPAEIFYELIKRNPALADNISGAIAQRRQSRQSVFGIEENVDQGEQYRRVKETLKHLMD